MRIEWKKEGGAEMGCTPCSGGQTLLLLATAVSLQLAQGRSAEELGLMSAFLVALGDNLALLAACQPSDSD